MNDGKRFRQFGRSLHIDIGPLRDKHGNTNYAKPGDADTARISSVICGAAALACPSARRNCIAPEGINARYGASACHIVSD
jgi:hypothetical protein